MHLVLGTAQFGLDYGISNRQGQVPQDEVERILGIASDLGVVMLDTAPAYGQSEAALGAVLGGSREFKILTKTPFFDTPAIGSEQITELRETFFRSLEYLGCPRIYGLLVHRSEDLTKPGGHLIVETMTELAKEGFIEKIGVSVYSGMQIDHVMGMFTPNIIQCPLNVFDQRLIKSGHLEQLSQAAVDVHLRSIFLQGLLLMDLNEIPRYFSPIRDLIASYFDLLHQKALDKLEVALAFALTQRSADAAVIGVTTAAELREIVQGARDLPENPIDFARFAIDDRRYIDPSCWVLCD